MATTTAPQRPGDEQVLGKAYDVRLIGRLSKYVRPHKVLLVAWAALMLTTIAFELAQPYLFMYSLQHHILTPKPDALPVGSPGTELEFAL